MEGGRESRGKRKTERERQGVDDACEGGTLHLRQEESANDMRCDLIEREQGQGTGRAWSGEVRGDRASGL